MAAMDADRMAMEHATTVLAMEFARLPTQNPVARRACGGPS
jgi:hypothetical protein